MGLYLGKQRIIAINEKIATKQWVTDQGYLKNTNLSDYITNEQLQPVSDKIDDVSAKVEDISTKIIKKGSLGTINGKSIENGNNVTIDLTLFKVVDSLPVSDIDVNKIYLLPNPAGANNNTYIEYMYINGSWEVAGEYKSEMSLDNYYTKGQSDEKFLTKAEVGNLADYVKNGELDTKVGEAGYVKTEALTTTLTSYAKKTDIPSVPTKLSELTNDSGYITTYTETDPVWTSEKSNYYTKTEIDNKNYLTEHQSLADYAKKTELPKKLSELTNDSGYITTYTETDPVWTSEKSNYYTKTEIDNKNYLTEHQSLADYVKNGELDTKVEEAGYVKTDALTTTLTSYAKKTDIPTVPTKLSELINDSSFITTYTETDPVWTSEKVNYYTKTEIDGKNYLTEHQSLADYAKKSEIPTDYVKNGELDTKVSEAGYVKTEALTTTLTSYAKKSEIPTDYVHNTELADYATITYVTEQIGSINSVLENI